MSEAREIAKRLGKEQRDAVVARRGSHAVITSAEVQPLWYAITKHEPDDFSITLTSIGSRVRTILQEQHHD